MCEDVYVTITVILQRFDRPQLLHFSLGCFLLHSLICNNSVPHLRTGMISTIALVSLQKVCSFTADSLKKVIQDNML